MTKFNIGDKLHRKNTRDYPVMIIENIYYRDGLETEYEIKPILFCGQSQVIGEEALIELYNKIKIE